MPGTTGPADRAEGPAAGLGSVSSLGPLLRPELAELTDVVGPKRTALGEGWFVTTESTWEVAGEPVAEMRFRVLKYRPGSDTRPAPRKEPIRPVTATSRSVIPTRRGR